MKTYAIIVAAGSGSRMGSGTNKQFIMIGGVPVLAHTLMAFDDSNLIDNVIIVTRSEDILTVNDLIHEFEIQKVTSIIPGGESRQDSVRLGLELVEPDCYVLIHDGARPFISANRIDDVIIALDTVPAAALGVPVKDTIKSVDADGRIKATLNRAELVQIQTPQGFHSSLIKEAHEKALQAGLIVTDDCALAEELGIPIQVIPGDYTNIKITTQEDLRFAEGLL